MMDEILFKFNQVLIATMDTVLKNILVCATTGIVAYFFYYTVLLYLKKSKYRHIPGPPEHGY